MGKPVRYSLVPLAIGSAAAAFGLYWIVFGVDWYLDYERNLAMCTTPLCGPPPPPVWSFVTLGLLFVLAGLIPLAWGIVRMRRERRQLSHGNPA